MKMIVLFLVSILTLGYCNAQDVMLPTKRLTAVVDAYPVASPDGKLILFQSNRTGAWELYTINLEGGDLKQLTSDKAEYATPVWAPDGKKIIFASTRDDKDGDIYIMDSDGKNQKRLTQTPGDDSHPKFSPDGKTIIFCSARTSPDLTLDWGKQFIEIFTMKADGTEPKQITQNRTLCTYPSISPDGNKIAFRKIISTPGMNWDLTTARRNSEVFVINMNGTEEVNISNNPAYDGWPAWSMDGRVIFSSNRGGIPWKGQLYMVGADGKGMRKLTDIKNSFIQASISPDGKFIVCQDNIETPDFEFGGISILQLYE